MADSPASPSSTSLRKEQPYNLQLIPYRSDCWNRRIAFRENLRSHPQTAWEYADLEKRLARDLPLDRPAYTPGKDSFIRLVTERAFAGLTKR